MIRSDAAPPVQGHEPATEARSSGDSAATSIQPALTYDERLDPIFTQQFAEHVAVREQGGLVIEWEEPA